MSVLDTSLNSIEFSEDIHFNAPFYETEDSYTISDIMLLYPSVDNLKIFLPYAPQCFVGTKLDLVNKTNFNITLYDYSGAVLIKNILPLQTIIVYLAQNDTSSGVWGTLDINTSSSSSSGIEYLEVSSQTSAITVTDGIVTGASGYVTLGASSNVVSLNNIDSPGIVVFSNNAFTVREIVGSDNITVTNSLGENGNPVIKLNSSLTNIASFQLGTLSLSSGSISVGNTILNSSGLTVSSLLYSSTGITAIDGISDIKFSAFDTSSLYLNDITIDSTNNLVSAGNITSKDLTLTGESFNAVNAACVVKDLTVTGTFQATGAQTDAWVTFEEVSISGGAVINIIKESSIASVTGRKGQYEIVFSNSYVNSEYGVHVSLGTFIDNEPPLSPTFAYYYGKETDRVRIAVTDINGQFVNILSSGVTVTILALT